LKFIDYNVAMTFILIIIIIIITSSTYRGKCSHVFLRHSVVPSYQLNGMNLLESSYC